MEINSKKIKKDFKIFGNYKSKYGKELIYLDSAATSLTPNIVVENTARYYEDLNTNIGRSSFGLAVQTEKVFEKSRVDIAKFLGVNSKNLIFTSGATDSINKIVNSFLSCSRQTKILTTISEHNSVLLPLIKAEKETKIYLAYMDTDRLSDFLNLEKEIKKIKPDMFFIQHVNSVTGKINDIKKISDVCRKYNCAIVVDGSQAVGHINLNIKKINCDAYFFSGHKMFGPTGIGCMYMTDSFILKNTPHFLGGGTVYTVTKNNFELKKSPYCFEPGTQNISGVFGMGAAVNYLNNVGVLNIKKYLLDLNLYAHKELNKIYGLETISDKKGVGIVSFTLDGIHPHDIEHFLSEKGIAVRVGYVCSELYVKRIIGKPIIRVSIHIYNSKKDVDILIKNLLKIQKIFK